MTGTPMLACGPAYTYTADGKLLKRTWARGAVTDYSYTTAGELALMDYADAATPDVVYTYDRLGRIAQVTDGSGTRTFSYDPTTLAQAAETLAMTGAPAPVTLTRNRDSIERYTGYALTRSGETLTSATYGYDSIGHLATADNVTFGYEPQSDRVATLTHALADGRTLVSHTAVEANRGLIDYVSHTVKAPGQPDVLVSKYDYANNAIGQRIGVNRTGTAIGTEQVVSYGYDTLGQVTSAQSTVLAETSAYAYDPIGNRLTSTEGGALASTYTANNLNQYTQVQGSQAQEPAYDADGSMTTLVNSTGAWDMTWNGENRLVEMTKPDQRLVFAYDSMGRRWKKEIYAGTSGNWTLQSSHRYLYDGFVQITELDAQATYAPNRSYRWDPTAGKATRVLSMTLHGTNAQILAFTHDGNKNTDSLIAVDGTLVGHYAYGPFGQVIAATGSLASANPYRFSSEFEDGECGLVYYNWRHYDLFIGRWTSRDPIGEDGGMNVFSMLGNNSISFFDRIGLAKISWTKDELQHFTIEHDVHLPSYTRADYQVDLDANSWLSALTSVGSLFVETTGLFYESEPWAGVYHYQKHFDVKHRSGPYAGGAAILAVYAYTDFASIPTGWPFGTLNPSMERSSVAYIEAESKCEEYKFADLAVTFKSITSVSGTSSAVKGVISNRTSFTLDNKGAVYGPDSVKNEYDCISVYDSSGMARVQLGRIGEKVKIGIATAGTVWRSEGGVQESFSSVMTTLIITAIK